MRTSPGDAVARPGIGEPTTQVDGAEAHVVKAYRPLGAGTKRSVCASLLACDLASSCGVGQEERPPLVITHVANEGFLIDCAGTKTLIDALFDGQESVSWYVPPDSVIGMMMQAKPPFDDVDLVAVTHAHADHFDAGITAAHLESNRDGILVCPPQAAQKLQPTAVYTTIKHRIRIVPAPGDTVVPMSLPGIDVRVLPTRHGGSGMIDEKTGKIVDRHGRFVRR